MIPVEDMSNFFQVELNTIEGSISGSAALRMIYEQPPALEHSVRGFDPQVTLRRSDVPAGTKVGDLVTLGLMQYKIRDRAGAGSDLVRYRLEAGPTLGPNSFYKITVAPGDDPPALTLDMEEGWPDDITHYLTCVQGGYIMLPTAVDVSAIIADGLLELVDEPMLTSYPRLYFYRAGVYVYNDEGEIESSRLVQFAHDFDTEDYGFYLSIPINSIIGLPDWRSIGAMVSMGLITPLNW